MTLVSFLTENPAIPGFLGLGLVIALHLATGVWTR
jgi:hypothetical protein